MIKLCKFNSYHEEVSNFLIEKVVEHTIEECLGRCDLCHSGAFIQIGDDYIAAEDGKSLIEKIRGTV